MKKGKNLNYRMYTGKSEAHKAFNSLAGIIEGISIDKKVTKKEIDELGFWCDNHEYLATVNPFNEIITNIQVIISDNEVTEEEIDDMMWLCDKFKHGFDYYDVFTADLQKLQGICHGILADGIIEDKEIIELKKWLDENQHLSTYYPYDEVDSLIESVLADGIIDDNERKLLKAYFNEFVNLGNIELQKKLDRESKVVEIGGICSKVSEIRFIENQFCFTGTSTRSSRKKVIEVIQEYGGKYVNSVSKKTQYLIVGDNGNPCWAFACYGRKVEKAITLRKMGVQIIIAHENDFWHEIDKRSN